MNEEFLSGLTISHIVEAIYRQRRKALNFAISFVLLVFIALLLIPKKYESEGRLFVRLGRGGVTLDPTATTGQTITIQEPREAEISSIVDFIQSRTVLEKVIENPAVGADRVLKSKFILSRIGLPSIPNFFGKSDADFRYDELKKMDLAIKKLNGSIYVKSPQKAATISIWCTSESPEFSQTLVDTLMKTYVKEHVEARKTDGSFSFFETQFNEQQAKVDAAASRLSKYKNRIGVMAIDNSRKALREKISIIEKNLIDADASLASARSRAKRSKGIAKNIPSQLMLEETEGVAMHSSDLMRDRLYQLELEERQLLANYTPQHPLVQAVKARVDQAREILKSQETERTVVKKGINTNKQAFEMNVMNSEVEASGVDSKQQVLTDRLLQAKSEMDALNRHEIEFAELKRELEIAEANLRIYASKMEEARINLELDHEQISNVKIVQPASLQVKHVSPRKSIILLASMICAFLGAIGFALIADWFSGTVSSVDDVNEILNLELLASIPSLQVRNTKLLTFEGTPHDS